MEAGYPPEVRRVLRECDESDAKAPTWRRLFPAASSHAYLGFFDVDRPANVALAEAYLRRHRTAKAPREAGGAVSAGGGEGGSRGAAAGGGRHGDPLGARPPAEAPPPVGRPMSAHTEPPAPTPPPPGAAEVPTVPPSPKVVAGGGEPVYAPKPPLALGAAQIAAAAMRARVDADPQPKAQSARGPRPVHTGHGGIAVSPLQARDALSTYLVRVQGKLRAEMVTLRGSSEPSEAAHADAAGAAMDARLDVIERLVARHHCPAPDGSIGRTSWAGDVAKSPRAQRLQRCAVLTQRLAAYLATYDMQTERLAEKATVGFSRAGGAAAHAVAKAREDFRAWLGGADDAQLEALLAQFISIASAASAQPATPAVGGKGSAGGGALVGAAQPADGGVHSTERAAALTERPRPQSASHTRQPVAPLQRHAQFAAAAAAGRHARLAERDAAWAGGAVPVWTRAQSADVSSGRDHWRSAAAEVRRLGDAPVDGRLGDVTRWLVPASKPSERGFGTNYNPPSYNQRFSMYR
ncbi:hypothetical protein T492DRAFT_1152512 [Pavlovales sp. CCMP2436]|nr:hypothetical protein T492DRAFT_1152512 [Pavlovales sp. CCMP2436]